MPNKILLFTGNFLPKIGGAELVIYNLAKHLTNDGYDVLVLCGGLPGDNSKTKKLFPVNFKVVRYPYGYKGAGKLKLNIAFSLIFLFYFIKIRGYKTVHAHFAFHPGYVCAILKKILDFKFILTFHGGDDFQECPEVKMGVTLNNPKAKSRINYLIKKADIVTALSKSIYDDLSLIPGINKSRLIIIPNGYDDKIFFKKDSTEIKLQLGLPSNARIIISVGRENPIKNHKFTINAFSELLKHSSFIDVEKTFLIIIGKNVTKHASYIKDLGINNKIFLLDAISPPILAKYYNISSLFISSSYIEGFGITTVEAMACGLPVIVTDVPGSRDIVNESVGFKVELETTKEMVDKMALLLSNKSLHSTMSNNAVVEAKKYYWDNIVKMYEKIY